jgi:hypothetical protein
MLRHLNGMSQWGFIDVDYEREAKTGMMTMILGFKRK